MPPDVDDLGGDEPVPFDELIGTSIDALDEPEEEGSPPVGEPEDDYWERLRRERAGEARDVVTKLMRQQLMSYSQDVAERKRYAGRVYILMCVSLAALFAVVALVGLGKNGSVSVEASHPYWLVIVSVVCFLGMFGLVFRKDRHAYSPEPPEDGETDWQKRHRSERNQAKRDERASKNRNIGRIQWLLFALGVLFGLPLLGEWFGFSLDVSGFSIETPVLVALATGVTVQVILVFAIVARSLFPDRKDPFPYDRVYDEMSRTSAPKGGA